VASSSRRSVVSALGSVAAAVVLAACAGPERARSERRVGPLIAFRTVGKVRRGEPPPARAGDALWLALAAPPPAARDRAIDFFAGLLEVALARTMPGLVDCISEDVDAALARERAWLLPTLTAAQTLVERRWSVADLDARIVERADQRQPDEGLVAAWPGDDALADEGSRRARFAAWPLTHGVLIDRLGQEKSARTASLLRERTVLSGSTLALVLDAALQRRQREPPALRELVAGCRKHRRLLGRAGKAHPAIGRLLALSEVTSEALLPWLSLSANELLAVPRLGALARRDAFLAEVRAAI
jgi:hypothetical protein